MTILHITAFALRGGCEKNCFHFCEGVPDARHDIIVLDKQGPMSLAWQRVGANVAHLDLVRENLFLFGRELRRQLAGKKYDLVILWSTIRLPLQLHAVKNVTGKVRVYLGNPLMANYRSLKDRILAAFYPPGADVKLMSCSAYVAGSHKGDGYFGRFPLQVSLNPVSLPATDPQKELTAGEFTLGMVARLDPIKDHATVLRSFKEILAHIPSARLHFVGDGSLLNDLIQFSEQEGISSFVFFHGDVEDVYHFLNQWDIFVYATTLSEGLGSVVAEAMANGLPCVLSDLPMLRELAPEDNLVAWFKKGDAKELSKQVIRLHQNKDLRLEYGRSAFQYAHEHFGVDRFVSDYLR